MSEIQKQILDFLKRNRVSTTEVADCLGKTGVLDDIHPVNSGMYSVGVIHYIYGHSESNWSIHDQARDVREGEVVLMDGIHVNKRALAGELICKFLIYYRMAAAVVGMGHMRDANDLIKNRFPVWCRGVTPVGCFNNHVEESEDVKRIVAERRAKYDGGIAVCDDTGVVVIPRDMIGPEFLTRLDNIEKQEDIWFNCIDFKKWDTYDTVCLKRYLEEDE